MYFFQNISHLNQFTPDNPDCTLGIYPSINFTRRSELSLGLYALYALSMLVANNSLNSLSVIVWSLV